MTSNVGFSDHTYTRTDVCCEYAFWVGLWFYLWIPYYVYTYAVSSQAMSPDLRRKVDQNRAARLAMESETQRQVEAQVRLMRILYDTS